jgi:hypothetical protein
MIASRVSGLYRLMYSLTNERERCVCVCNFGLYHWVNISSGGQNSKGAVSFVLAGERFINEGGMQAAQEVVQ